MINLPSDYDQAQSFNGNGGLQLTAGGHICRIRGAKMEKTKNTGKDMLVIAFDIFEQGEFTDYYKKMFDRMKAKNPDAKWAGIFRTTITNSDGKTNGFFKGLIESVEASNSGYDFRASGCNEISLQGKIVGFNFGEEEYLNSYGEVKTSVKPMYAVSVADINSGTVIPPTKKLLDQNRNAPVHQTEFTELTDESLPF